jgi:hypothetical protein
MTAIKAGPISSSEPLGTLKQHLKALGSGAEGVQMLFVVVKKDEVSCV